MNVIGFWVEHGKETKEQLDLINRAKEYSDCFLWLGKRYNVVDMSWEHYANGYQFKMDMVEVCTK